MAWCNIVNTHGTAVSGSIEASLTMTIPAGVHIPGVRVKGEANGRNVGVRERKKFAVLHNCVGVRVLPNPQLSKHRVLCGDAAIAIGVEICERLKAIGRLAPVGQWGVIAKQLSAGIDLAIVISVEHQQTIGPGHPTGPLCKPVVVEIEMAPPSTPTATPASKVSEPAAIAPAGPARYSGASAEPTLTSGGNHGFQETNAYCAMNEDLRASSQAAAAGDRLDQHSHAQPVLHVPFLVPNDSPAPRIAGANAGRGRIARHSPHGPTGHT